MTIERTDFTQVHEVTPGVNDYPFAFGAMDAAFIHVYDIDPMLPATDPAHRVRITDVVVTPAPTGIQTGGTVRIPTLPPVGHQIEIRRSTDMVQERAFDDQNRVFPKTIERGFDWLTMISQELGGAISMAGERVVELQSGLEKEVEDRVEADAGLSERVDEAVSHANAVYTLAEQAHAAAQEARAAADAAEEFAREADEAAGLAREDAANALAAVGNKADASELAKYLPLAGGTMTGNLTITDGELFIYDANGQNPLPVRSTLFGFRQPLTANRTYYIRTDGDDASDGINTPIKSFSRLRVLLASCDFKGKDCTINIGPGTWNERFYLSASDLYGCRFLSIVGSGSQQTKIITDGTSIELGVGPLGGVRNRMNGIGVGGGSGGIVVSGGSHFLMDDIDFGEVNANAIQLYIHSGAQADFWDTKVSISGGGLCHLRCATGGRCLYNYASVTVKATSNFSTVFEVIQQSFLSIYGATFTNKDLVTGRRFTIREMSGINTSGGGDNFLPGSLPGAVGTASGGFYG